MSKIRCIVEHRGVGLHDQQPPERLKVVKAEIDRVLDDLNTIQALFAWCKNTMRSPESRSLAASKIEALWSEVAAKRGRRPPDITLDDVAASVAGCNSEEWRSPTQYGPELDVSPQTPRERPLRR